MVDRPGVPAQTYTVDGEAAMALLNQAVDAAKAAKLPWMAEKLVLKPAPELIDLVRRSQEVTAAEDDEGA
jgi:CRISPR-associated protein Csb1